MSGCGWVGGSTGGGRSWVGGSLGALTWSLAMAIDLMCFPGTIASPRVRVSPLVPPLPRRDSIIARGERQVRREDLT